MLITIFFSKFYLDLKEEEFICNGYLGWGFVKNLNNFFFYQITIKPPDISTCHFLL